MELGQILRMILRGWWIVALTTLSAVAIALVSSFIATPMYRAQASFVISPNKAIVPNQNLVDSLGTLDKRSIIATYNEVVNSNRIYNEAIAALQMDPNDSKNYAHTSVVLPDANVIELSVTGPDPQHAAVLANTIGQHGITYVKGLYQAYDINLLDPAIPPTVPYSPQPLRDISLALVLGFALGSILAIGASRGQPARADIRRLPQYEDAPAPHYSGQYIQRR